jgi:hypothetical protein
MDAAVVALLVACLAWVVAFHLLALVAEGKVHKVVQDHQEHLSFYWQENLFLVQLLEVLEV